ncbi:hypothetical protein Pmani_000504 [Petrolisthes manimaculis]|uniref:Carboxypeptidase n=1 Tax=Petrolisthes manimaculis TaxID=1843537 RepID=A0AAE1QLJ0_9EUCA|nr:hypothetical protein Pmani_000504 [Petrolisthes manimaculis]
MPIYHFTSSEEDSVTMKEIVPILALVMVLVLGTEGRGPFQKMFPTHGNLNLPSGADAGDPLFLTPLLEAGKIQEARALSHVQLGHRHSHSFSGFFTVNKTFSSNLFFWFFPARTGADNAPVVIWLQGGPGGSSLFGLFTEHGPFSVDSKLRLVPRQYAWTKTLNVLYVDNPVGTGFSFTKDNRGYARNQTAVGADLYQALLQFFTLFPELQHNAFYVTGESYAGKYVPALAYTIHKNNPAANLKINLQGLAIGDGLCDPVTMTDYGDLLYQVGLIDSLDKEYFKNQSDQIVSLINKQQWLQAFTLFDDLLNGDKSGHPSYFTNVTGLTNYYNFLANGEPEDMNYWSKYINQATVRRAIHVGNLTFNDGSVVETNLEEDIMKSVKPWIEELLDNYLVLIYNGQLDIIIGYTLTENFLDTLDWKMAGQFQQSPRYVWKVDGQVAGYVREVPGFVQILVRNAGHMIPYDQPQWAFDMINRFTAQKSFA